MSSIRRDQRVKNLFSTTDLVKYDLAEELWHLDSTEWFLEVEAHLAEQQQKILPWTPDASGGAGDNMLGPGGRKLMILWRMVVKLAAEGERHILKGSRTMG